MSKIMIVDDDPNIRELVSTLLQNHGFDACEAADGLDALHGGRTARLRLFDMRMNGLALATTASNAAGSLMASSLSIFRFSSTPDSARAGMKRL